MSEDSEDEDVERLSHNTVESSNIQEKTAEMPVIGAALKSGASKDFTERVTRPKKRQSKISWRQRLQDARKRPHEDNSDLSGSDSSLSSDSEFSSWSGFSSDEDEAVEEAHNGDINGHTEGSQDEDDPSDSEDEREQDADKRQRIDVIQRAKGFKEWAREQTGLGGSVSNITSLPVLPPGQRETLVSSAKGKMDDLEPPSRNKPPKQVQLHFTSMLTAGVLRFCTTKAIYTRVSPIVANCRGRTANNGDTKRTRHACHLWRNWVW